METFRFLMVTTHFPPLHIGGDAVFGQYLSRELSRIGHEVHVLTYPSIYRMLRGAKGQGDDTIDDFDPTLHIYEPKLKRLDTGFTYVFGSAKGAERKLAEISGKVKPDVIHWHNTKAFFAKIPGNRDSKSVYTAHDYYAICPRSNRTRPDGSICSEPRMCQLCLLKWRKVPQIWRAGRKLINIFPRDIRILCPSRFMAKRLESQGLSVSDVLPNFVPEPIVRTQANVSDERKVIYVGILERHKGVHTLLDAFSRCRGDQDFKLIVVGKGSLKQELVGQAKKLGIDGRVDITGFLPREEIQRHLRESDAMIIPSEWSENAPLVAIEALSYGVPIIGSNAGGIPEIAGRDSDSMLFESGNSEDLSRCITKAWARGNQSSGTNSRRAYEASFSPKAHLGRYFEILELNG